MDALAAILLAFLLMGLVAFLTVLLTVLLAVLLGRRAMRKRNRVSPTTPSAAPVSWMGAPSATARLHRRLRAAVAVARSASAAAPTAPRLTELTAELEQEAVALDAHLVMVARLPARERRARLAGLTPQVLRVEQCASQVSLLAVQSQAPMLAAGRGSALDDLAHQLDLLEEARGEVARIEADAGLHRASPYATGAADPSAGTPWPGA